MSDIDTASGWNHESSSSLGRNCLGTECNHHFGGDSATLPLQQTRLRSADGAGLLPDVRGSQLLRSGVASVLRGGTVLRMPAELQPGALRYVRGSLVLRPVRAELRSAVYAELSDSDLPGAVCAELSGAMPAELQRAVCSKLSGSLCSIVLRTLMLCAFVPGAEL